MKIDGLAAGYAPSGYATAINNRLAVPCHVDIDVNIVGNASGGTAYYSITAEQDLGVTSQIKVWSVIEEDHETATSAWGGYSGQEMMWIPVAWPLGTAGSVLNFTGPYPQTISVSAPYTLTPASHVFNNLNVATFVQLSTGTRECLNAHFMDLPDTATGVEGPSGAELASFSIDAWPNPSHGALSIAAIIPDGTAGQVRIYDILGRTVSEFAAGGITSVTVGEPGVYFARLETSSGEVASTRFTVVR